MSYEFRDIEKEIKELTKNKPKKQVYVLKQLDWLNTSLIMLRAEKLHGKKFLEVPKWT